MSNNSKVIDTVKSILDKFGVKGIKLSEEPQKVEFQAKGMTADGVEVMTPTEWAEGAEVFQMDADGNPVPVPDGTYVIDSANQITVEGGKITTVAPAQAEAKMSDDIKNVVSQLAERVQALEAEKATLSKAVEDEKTKSQDLQTKLSATEKKLADLGKQAAAKSVTDKDQDKTELKKEDKKPVSERERLKAIIESTQN